MRLDRYDFDAKQAGVGWLVTISVPDDPLGVLASEEELDRLAEARSDDAVEAHCSAEPNHTPRSVGDRTRFDLCMPILRQSCAPEPLGAPT